MSAARDSAVSCIPCRLKASPCAGTLVIWTERIFPAQKKSIFRPPLLVYFLHMADFWISYSSWCASGSVWIFLDPDCQSVGALIPNDWSYWFYVRFLDKYLIKYYPRYLFCTTTQEISHETYIRFLFSTSYLGSFLSFNHCVILARLFLMKFFLAMRA